MVVPTQGNRPPKKGCCLIDSYLESIITHFVVFQVISYLIGMLRNALGQSDLRGRSEGTTWSCHEIADGLCNLVVNEKNMVVMLDRDVLPLLISLIGKGDATEKECAANILWIIAKTSKGKTKIKETSNAMEELTRLSKSGNQAIQEAAKRVLLELKETRTTQGRRARVYRFARKVFFTIASLREYLSSAFLKGIRI